MGDKKEVLSALELDHDMISDTLTQDQVQWGAYPAYPPSSDRMWLLGNVSTFSEFQRPLLLYPELWRESTEDTYL